MLNSRYYEAQSVSAVADVIVSLVGLFLAYEINISYERGGNSVD